MNWETEEWTASFKDEDEDIELGFGTSIVPITSTDYVDARNKPQINGVTLVGNKTNDEIGIMPLTNIEINEILNNFIG